MNTSHPIASAAAAVLAATTITMAAPTPGAPMFRGNAAHTGVYATSGPRTLGSPAWVFKAGGPILSSAAVVDGVVFVGSDDRSLHTLDATTGAEQWAFATQGRVRSSPAVTGGTVYFGSYDGVFYAISAADGALKWKFETGGERRFEARGLHGFKPRTQTIPDFWDLYLSSPVVAGGIVYFGCGDGHLYALDAATGGLRWKFAAGDVIHASPALVDGTVYFGSWDTFLYALDATTGAERWRFKTGEDKDNHNRTGIQSSPAVVDGVVYFGCRDFNVYAVDAATGTEKWKFNLTWVIGSPAVHDDTIYFGTSIPSFFVAVDATTGAEKYRLKMPLMVYSSPAIADGLAYFGSFDGGLYAVDAAGGGIVSAYHPEAAQAHRRDLLNEDGSFNTQVIFRSDSFEEMYLSGARFEEAGAILASPVVVDGTLYVGTMDGSFFAFR